MFRHKKQKGIGLLELMLSLAIIAVLLTMAVRYFVAANQKSNVTQAADVAQGLIPCINYLVTTAVAVNKTYTLNLDSCRSSGNIPDSFYADASSVKTPWGNMPVEIADTTTASFSDAKITFTTTKAEIAQLYTVLCPGKAIPASLTTSFAFKILSQTCSP